MRHTAILLTALLYLAPSENAQGQTPSVFASEDARFKRYVDYYMGQGLRRASSRRPADVQRLMFFNRLLGRIDYDALGVDGQIDFDILRTRVMSRIDGWALNHGKLPEAAAFLPPADFLNMVLDLMKPGRDLDRLVSRMTRAVRKAERLPDWLKSALKKGIDKAHKDVAVFASMRNGTADDLARALKKFKEHLASLEPPKTGPPRRTPSALERYRYRVRYTLLARRTPEELFELGKRKYRETVRELERVARAIDPDKTWREILDDCKRDGWEAEEIHENAKNLALRARDFAIAENLVTIPDSARDFAVRRGSTGQITPFGHYRPGGRRRKGTYVTPPVTGLDEDTLKERTGDNNVYWTTIVALHEAVPGHHLQFEVARKLKRSALRRMANTSTYTEGWGLYCEEMMFRAGYYEWNTKQRLVALQMRLWRCSRVVIDVGLNLGAITQEEGVALLVNGVRMSPSSAKLEVSHYSRRPTYFCGYLLGFLAFTEVREACEKKLGDTFNLKAFHDFILNLGPLPLDAMRKAVLDWADRR